MKHYSHFTKEQIDWLIENAGSKTKTQDFNRIFNEHRSAQALRQRLRFSGVIQPMQKRIAQEEIDFLKKTYSNCIDTREALEKYNAKYNKNFSLRQFNQYCENHHIYRSKRSISINRHPIGHEIVDTDGFVWVKIKNPKYTYKNFREAYVLKHRLKYEEYHNTRLDKNDRIIFLNGDKKDFSKENLIKVSNHELSILRGKKWLYKGVITQAALEIIKAQDVLKEIEK